MEAIEDAEVISEGPKPPPPPPRAAELKPADAFGVFDGGVDDAPNAKKRPAEGAETARAKAKGRSKKQAPQPEAPPVDPLEKQRRARRAAERAVDTFVNLQLGMVRARYAGILEPASLEQLIDRIKFTPQEREGWVEPLTEGMLENDIELPWWAALAIQAFMSITARKALLEQLERTYQAKKESDEAAAKAAAAGATPAP